MRLISLVHRQSVLFCREDTAVVAAFNGIVGNMLRSIIVAFCSFDQTNYLGNKLFRVVLIHGKGSRLDTLQNAGLLCGGSMLCATPAIFPDQVIAPPGWYAHFFKYSLLLFRHFKSCCPHVSCQHLLWSETYPLLIKHALFNRDRASGLCFKHAARKPCILLPFCFCRFYPDRTGCVENDVVNHAKIRASYAEVGQAGDFRENFYSVPTYGGGFYSLTPILYPINGSNGYTPYYKIYDPNLKPQNTRVLMNWGQTWSFFDNLVTLNYTFSRQNVKDQIFDVPLASSTGAGKLVTNGGKLHTNVHEITLSFNPIRTRDINWDFGFNWTK